MMASGRERETGAYRREWGSILSDGQETFKEVGLMWAHAQHLKYHLAAPGPHFEDECSSSILGILVQLTLTG